VVEGSESEGLQAALAIVRQATVRLASINERFPADTATITGRYETSSDGRSSAALRIVAERLYSNRRIRDAMFPPGLFGEPAWDLLLALYIAQDEGKDLTLAKAYAAAKVDPREGPALIDRLVSAGVVLRNRTRQDRRCKGVALTESAFNRLTDYLIDLV
jgi:hypothetical protein